MSQWIDDIDLEESGSDAKEEETEEEEEDGPAAWEQAQESSESEEEEAKKPEPVKPEPVKPEPIKQEKETSAPKSKIQYTEMEAVPEHQRSPICVIMGHVDTGKTKILDKIRHSNIQDGEAGGITQQIGATYFPESEIKRRTQFFKGPFKLEYNIPGLLIIDTPGHESFSNLRSRGSSLCDIAILVIDIMHGVENQTLESLQMLVSKKVPFIIALNKIDRLSGWQSKDWREFVNGVKVQDQHTMAQYQKGLQRVITQLGQQGLNGVPFNNWVRNISTKIELEDVPIVPTSAITGEGIPDLLAILQLRAHIQMKNRLTSKNELQCTVLEVKVEQGMGTTLDVILVNGVLHVNDIIVLAGMNGPIVSRIRALLTPAPLKELRVRSEYLHHDKIYAAMGCKISGPDLQSAIAGSELFVAHSDEDVEILKKRVEADITAITSSVNKNEDGLLVQASTLGSLEALLSYLKSQNVNVAAVGIGPLYKKDIQQILHIAQANPKYACVLCFNVEISADAKTFAQQNDIKIFSAEIIYHLTDMYAKYIEDLKVKAREAARAQMVWPVEFQYLEKSLIHRSKPIIIGIKVLDGTLKKGTPISTIGENARFIGTVDSIQVNQQPIEEAKIGQECAILIKDPASWSPEADKDFHPKDIFVSKLTRPLIDLLKEHFRDELAREDWELVRKIKGYLKII